LSSGKKSQLFLEEKNIKKILVSAEIFFMFFPSKKEKK